MLEPYEYNFKYHHPIPEVATHRPSCPLADGAVSVNTPQNPALSDTTSDLTACVNTGVQISDIVTQGDVIDFADWLKINENGFCLFPSAMWALE